MIKWHFVVYVALICGLVFGPLAARGSANTQGIESQNDKSQSKATDKRKETDKTQNNRWRMAQRETDQEKVDEEKVNEGKVDNLRISPHFDFSIAGFRAFVQNRLEPAYHQNVEAAPRDFLERLAKVIVQERKWPYLSRLVDKQHSLSADYAPEDLVALETYKELNLVRSGLMLRSLVLPDLLRMHQAALAAGVAGSLQITSAYRSFAYQKQLFFRYAERDGEEVANRYAARSGQSQHQLGLTLDFFPVGVAFAKTAAGKWLLANALDYGFSLSYPDGQEAFTGYSYEPWHYRYVGREIAALIADYFGGSQQAFFLFWQRSSEPLKQHYRAN